MSFRFKRFTVRQEGAAMKVGTDSVLLGAWCPVEGRPRTALDIGTGTGLLALMIAQRCVGCRVDAVEIDADSFRQASANFAANPWRDRIVAYHSSIQDFTRLIAHGGYDLVVSNPPYFEHSLQSPNSSRTTARHTTDLTYGELIECAEACLSDTGTFAVILPHDATERFIALARQAGLHLHRRTDILPKPGTLPRRSLLALCKTLPSAPVNPDSLMIEQDGRHEYSAEYVSLTRDFYLKF